MMTGQPPPPRRRPRLLAPLLGGCCSRAMRRWTGSWARATFRSRPAPCVIGRSTLRAAPCSRATLHRSSRARSGAPLGGDKTAARSTAPRPSGHYTAPAAGAGRGVEATIGRREPGCCSPRVPLLAIPQRIRRACRCPRRRGARQLLASYRLRQAPGSHPPQHRPPSMQPPHH